MGPSTDTRREARTSRGRRALLRNAYKSERCLRPWGSQSPAKNGSLRRSGHQQARRAHGVQNLAHPCEWPATHKERETHATRGAPTNAGSPSRSAHHGWSPWPSPPAPHVSWPWPYDHWDTFTAPQMPRPRLAEPPTSSDHRRTRAVTAVVRSATSSGSDSASSKAAWSKGRRYPTATPIPCQDGANTSKPQHALPMQSGSTAPQQLPPTATYNDK